MTGPTVYHTGLLMRDRIYDRDVNALAHKMLRLSDQGEVTLLQRRRLDGVYDYLAVPRKVRHDTDMF